MLKRILSLALSAVLLVTALLCTSCSNETTDPSFDYNTTDLGKYVSLNLSDITGQTFTIAGDFPTITRADAEKKFRYWRLYYSEYLPEDTDVYVRKPGWGDYAYIYYDLSLTPGGQSIASNLFSGENAQMVQIGYWEFGDLPESEKLQPLFDNATVSDALTKILPATRRTSGTIAEGDVLRVSFTVMSEDGSRRIDRREGLRLDTGSYEIYEEMLGMAFIDELFAHKIGEKYSVNGTYTLTDASGKTTTQNVVYTDVVVSHAAQETFTQVEVKLPADAFDATYREELRALNGKTVYLNLFIDHFIDFLVPDFDLDFLFNTYHFKTTETETEKIKEAALNEMQKKLEAEQKQEILSAVFNGVFELLYSDERILSIPQKPLEEHRDYIVSYITSAFKIDQANAIAEGTNFPYENVDQYAAYYNGYTLDDYATLEDYATTVARETVMDRLLVFYMAQLSGTRTTLAELDQLYEEYFLHLQEQFPDYTADQILEKFDGEQGLRWYINWTVTTGELSDYLYKNNTIIFNGK